MSTSESVIQAVVFHPGQFDCVSVTAHLLIAAPSLLCVCRLDIDLSRLPVQQRQLYTRVLDPGKGRLVFLITLTPCSGVSVSDLSSPPLDDLQTSERVRDHHVSLTRLGRLGKDPGLITIQGLAV